MEQDDIGARIEAIRQRVARAAHRAGRDPKEVTILGASKQVEPERVLAAVALGINHLGENQVQEAEAKFSYPGLKGQPITLHLIGHLQTNKLRRALGLFDVIQSVDSPRLAQRIDRAAGELGRQVPIYIELNMGLESTKEGVRPDLLPELAEQVARCEHLALLGLMAVPPYSEDPEAARPYFRALRELRDSLYRLEPFQGKSLHLSMGMTHDFEVAIEEGATVVRLGTAIWGARPA